MSSLYLAAEYVTVTCGPSDRGGCGLPFALTREFYNETRRTKSTWYCPRGHARVWSGESTEQKLRRAETREIQLRDQLAAAVRDAESTRVALLRDRQRFANGVCPCCNRTFQNVLRHMQCEHPDYDVTKVKRELPRQFKCSCGRKFETLRGLRTHQGWSRREGWDSPATSKWAAHLTVVTR